MQSDTIYNQVDLNDSEMMEEGEIKKVDRNGRLRMISYKILDSMGDNL